MIKRIVKRLRYHYLASRVILVAAYPIIYFGRLAAWLKIRVKINGGQVTYYGTSLYFPRNIGVNILTRIYWNGDGGFEKYFGKFITAAFDRADVFFDVGSNFGFYSVLACKRNPHLFSYCFEPVDFLQRDNTVFHQANRVTNYQLVKKALGEEDGMSTLLVPAQAEFKFLITSATLSQEFAEAKGFGTVPATIEVERLDTFASALEANGRLNQTSAVLVKIDVEGFEYFVLKGARNFFQRFQPIVFIEIFMKGDNLKNILNFLEEAHYCVFAFSNIGLVHLESDLLCSYQGDRNFVLFPQKWAKLRIITHENFSTTIFRQ